MRVLVVAFTSGLVAGCGGSSSPDESAPADVGGETVVVADTSVTDTQAAPLTWTSVEVTKTTDKVIIEKVRYKSGDLSIVGQVCRPVGEGKRKVLIWTHGGFSGLGASEWNGGMCEGGANNGYAIVESSYRGEDGSDGKIEVCLGEVDDVLAMTTIALAQPWADASHVSLLGGSHGGCIALRAVQRGIPAHVAVDVFGVTDWAAEWNYWTTERAKSTPDKQNVYDALFKQLRESTGGTPTTHAEEYRKRSPINFAADLEKYAGQLMIIHGVLDELVTVSDSCRMAANLTAATPVHLDAAGNVITTKPAGCPEPFTWIAPPKPATWPAKRYLVVRDGAGHGAWVPATGMMDDAFAFIVAKLP